MTWLEVSGFWLLFYFLFVGGVGFYAYLARMNTQNKIIELIEKAGDVWTVRERQDLQRLAVKLAAEKKLLPTDTYIIEQLDESLWWKESAQAFDYIFHAHVLHMNIIYDVYVTGLLNYCVIDDGYSASYTDPGAPRETALGHMFFSSILSTLPGDPNETPVPFQEKALIEMVVDYFTESDYEQLVEH